MKTINKICTALLLIAIMVLPKYASAQAPEKMSYQAVVRDASNNLVNSTSVGMQISILQGSSNGTPVYVETHTPTSNTNGLVSIEIGTGTLISGDFSSIDWGDDTYFIQSETDPDGGTNYTITGTSQLLSVPYALHSKYADLAGNGIDSIDDNGDGTFTYAYTDGSSYTTPDLTGSQGATGNGISNTIDNGDGTFTFEYTDGSTFTTSDLTGPQGATGNGISNTDDNGDGTFTFEYTDGSTFTTSDLTGPQGATGNGISNTVDNGDGTITFEFTDGTTFTSSNLLGPQGATPGDLLYWDGSEWVIVPVGSPGQVLQLNVSGIPEWMGSGYASVTTDPITNIGATEAEFNGDVTADGGSAVTERGFVYATSPSPNLTDDLEIVGSGTGSFNATITGLTIGQTYYVRAYATNSTGTIYGNEISFETNSSYAMGDTGPAGGLVFYDKGSYSNGWRYMEANPVDLSTGTDWGCSGTLIPGSQPSAIENGPQNTQDIVANCGGTNIAARLCDNYSLNGFNDWFLPARQELDQMYLNLHSSGLGSFNSLSTYWSSTENNNISAQGVSFSSGNTINNNKSTSYRVRAARRF